MGRESEKKGVCIRIDSGCVWGHPPTHVSVHFSLPISVPFECLATFCRLLVKVHVQMTECISSGL